MLKRYRLQVVSTCVGVVLGYVLLHPYTMLVLALLSAFKGEPRQLHTELTAGHLAAFDPLMLPMAISFGLFGGLIGLLVGTLLKRHREFRTVEHENEKKRAALETLQEVVVTMSHHLLNANMIIGGKVRHCRKVTSDQDIISALGVIEEQARKIDVVVGALRKTSEIRLARYTSDGTVQMIDISREIEEEMAREKNIAQASQKEGESV